VVDAPEEWLTRLRHKAELRARAGLRRRLAPRGTGDQVIDLAGNDYLGLSRHPAVVAAATGALAAYGLGATGSRLVRGSTAVHADLESALAGFLGMDGALVYSSGYLANLGAVRALVQPNTLIVSDRHNHASLIDGCRSSGAEIAVVPHGSVAAAEAALRERGARPAVVVTESVFSVDGDLVRLADLHAACRRYGALLLVDDAHAVGVIGPSGAGGVAAAGLSGEPDVVVTMTLSKAFGAAGGAVAGPAELIAHLVDTGRTFIYDTGLPPPVAAGARAALDLIRAGDDLRAELHERAVLVGKRLTHYSGSAASSAAQRPGAVADHEVSEPDAGVVSVTAPGPEAAVAWAAACLARGVAVGCFRPPSTPDTRSRLRLTVNVGVPRADFEHALDVIAECAP
jgi:8-amino-7-oxononanoate synthase